MATSADNDAKANAREEAIISSAKELGYDCLKPKQLEVVSEFVSGKDVFVCLPTGSGKSLCYALLSLVFDKLTRDHRKPQRTSSFIVVVSPLIALMKDQVDSFKKKGIRSVYVSPTDEEAKLSVLSGEFQLVYISPETLITDRQWRKILESSFFSENLVGLVVDEAHCVKKWGDEFRKAFAKIGEVRSILPSNVNVMALTATATKPTREYVCGKLGMSSPVVISQSPNKVNIKYMVWKKEGSIAEILASLADELKKKRTAMPRTIIFAKTYEACGDAFVLFRSVLGNELTEPVAAPNDLARFRLVDMFTACTKKEVKNDIIQNFCTPDGKLRVVVATVAFGMGLDCPDIRRVIHIGSPTGVEEYLQETGRAGRDGKSSVAELHYSKKDFAFTCDNSMKKYCENTDKCRRALLLQDFDYDTKSEVVCTSLCACCDICQLSCSCEQCEFSE